MAKKSPKKSDKDPIKNLIPPVGKDGIDLAYLDTVWGRVLKCLWIPIAITLLLYFLFGS